jgi:hypothetical protein
MVKPSKISIYSNRQAAILKKGMNFVIPFFQVFIIDAMW